MCRICAHQIWIAMDWYISDLFKGIISYINIVRAYPWNCFHWMEFIDIECDIKCICVWCLDRNQHMNLPSDNHKHTQLAFSGAFSLLHSHLLAVETLDTATVFSYAPYVICDNTYQKKNHKQKWMYHLMHPHAAFFCLAFSIVCAQIWCQISNCRTQGTHKYKLYNLDMWDCVSFGVASLNFRHKNIWIHKKWSDCVLHFT